MAGETRMESRLGRLYTQNTVEQILSGLTQDGLVIQWFSGSPRDSETFRDIQKPALYQFERLAGLMEYGNPRKLQRFKPHNSTILVADKLEACVT
jgi:hypothetical protein